MELTPEAQVQIIGRHYQFSLKFEVEMILSCHKSWIIKKKSNIGDHPYKFFRSP